MGKGKTVSRIVRKTTRRWNALINRFPFCGSAYPDCPPDRADRDNTTCKKCAILRVIVEREQQREFSRYMPRFRKKKLEYIVRKHTIVVTFIDGTSKTFSVKAWDSDVAKEKVMDWIKENGLQAQHLTITPDIQSLPSSEKYQITVSE